LGNSKINTETYKDSCLQEWPDSGSIVIFDLEYTAWEGSHSHSWSRPGEYREIIQIGAVRMLVAKNIFKEAERFDRYVIPVINPKLSDYIVGLTGITNKTIEDQGASFINILEEFHKFVYPTEPLFSVGIDGEVLRENCLLSQVAYPFDRNQVFNIRSALANSIGVAEHKIVSSELPYLLNIKPPDSLSHNALSDARCIGAALSLLRTLGLL